MNNMRVLDTNSIDNAVLGASSQASTSMSVNNLLNERKSSPWRSTSLVAQWVSATWSVAELLSCVLFPNCNLSPAAKIRVRTTAEATTSNRILYSEQINNAAWGGGNSTVSPDATVAPDGTSTADKVIDNNTNGAHFVFQNVAGFTTGQRWTFSVYVKAAERSIVALRFDSSTTCMAVDSNAFFNLATGDITGVTGVLSYAISALPNGWYRISAGGTATANGSVCPLIMLSTNGTNYSFTGSGSAGAYVWGAMLSVGTLSSYYPTTNAATTRPQGYMDAWQPYDYDSGFVTCCPEPARKLRGFTAAQSASAYSYGGGSTARVWFPPIAATSVRVDFQDPTNLQGYIEATRFVAGNYWSTSYNPSQVRFGWSDTTTVSRAKGGDQIVDPGTIFSRLDLNLTYMPELDRTYFTNMVRNSRIYPIFVSIFPDSGANDVWIYGRRTKDSDIALEYVSAYTSDLSIESV